MSTSAVPQATLGRIWPTFESPLEKSQALKKDLSKSIGRFASVDKQIEAIRAHP